MKIIKEEKKRLTIMEMKKQWRKKITCKCRSVLVISFQDLFFKQVGVGSFGVPQLEEAVRCPSCKETIILRSSPLKDNGVPVELRKRIKRFKHLLEN
jgi:hypothetical protein